MVYLFIFLSIQQQQQQKKTRPRKKKKNKNELPCEILFWIRFVYTTSITDNGSTVKATAMERESDNTHTFLLIVGNRKRKLQQQQQHQPKQKRRGHGQTRGPGIPSFFLIHSIPFLSFYLFLSFFSRLLLFLLFLSLGFTRSRKLRDDTHRHTSPHGACSTSVSAVSLSYYYNIYVRIRT